MKNGRLSQKIWGFAGYDYTASTLPMLANHAIEIEVLGYFSISFVWLHCKCFVKILGP